MVNKIAILLGDVARYRNHYSYKHESGLDPKFGFEHDCNQAQLRYTLYICMQCTKCWSSLAIAWQIGIGREMIGLSRQRNCLARGWGASLLEFQFQCTAKNFSGGNF